VYKENFPAKVVIMDQDSQATNSASILVIEAHPMAECIIVDDSKQLNPFVNGPIKLPRILQLLKQLLLTKFIVRYSPHAILTICRCSASGVNEIRNLQSNPQIRHIPGSSHVIPLNHEKDSICEIATSEWKIQNSLRLSWNSSREGANQKHTMTYSN